MNQLVYKDLCPRLIKTYPVETDFSFIHEPLSTMFQFYNEFWISQGTSLDLKAIDRFWNDLMDSKVAWEVEMASYKFHITIHEEIGIFITIFNNYFISFFIWLFPNAFRMLLPYSIICCLTVHPRLYFLYFILYKTVITYIITLFIHLCI